jgi:phospholipid transport system substrate-binding protein
MTQRCRSNWRDVRLAALAAGLIAVAAARVDAAQALTSQVVAASASDPMVATKSMVNGALQVLRDPRVSLSDERRRLRTIAEAHLDFESMARSALGYHWRDLTPDQRARFTQLFKSFIEDAYLSRIQDYSGQEVIFTREKVDGADYGEVYSQVVGNGDEPIQLNFMLHRENGEWKIYDVAVDGISITGNYRTQFNRVLNNQGFDALMGDLAGKQQRLAEYLGKKK